MDENDLNEVLDIQQRQKRAQIMRRYKTKIERARELARTRAAGEGNIKKRAYAQARQIFRKRFAGEHGAEYEKLGPSEKIAVDRTIEKKTKAIKKLASRLVPKIKKAEYERLHSYMKGQAINNLGTSEGQVSESIDDMFLEYFGSSLPGNTGSTGERSDNPVVTSDRKVVTKKNVGDKNYAVDKVGKINTGNKAVPIIQYGKFGEELDNSIVKALAKKSDKTGIDIDVLGEVYNRGLDAWNESVNLSPQQYAFARVNSFINLGKTYFNEDSDLQEATIKIKSSNPGYGYHGYHGSKSDDEADKKYASMHAKVKKLLSASGHLEDEKKPNVIVKHFLDSTHGRHIAQDPSDQNIKNRFRHFKKSYNPRLFEETLDEEYKKGDTVFLKTRKYANSPHTGRVSHVTDTHVHIKSAGGTYKVSKDDVSKDRTQSYLHKNTSIGEEVELDEKRGLWDNIHAKRKRIKAGSGERMRKPGSKGAPTDQDFKDAQESVELDELSKKTLSSYTSKVGPSIQNMSKKITDIDSAIKVGDKSNKRMAGMNLAYKKMAKEEAELDEQSSENTKSRRKVQNVERDMTPKTPESDAKKPTDPHSDMFKQQTIKKKIIEDVPNAEKITSDSNKPSSRFQGTNAIVKTFKKATPFSEGLNESFNMAFDYQGKPQLAPTAAELRLQAQGGFAHHTDVQNVMEVTSIKNKIQAMFETTILEEDKEQLAEKFNVLSDLVHEAFASIAKIKESTFERDAWSEAEILKLERYIESVNAYLNNFAEEVTSAERAPVVIPAHRDAYGNMIPAKTVLRKTNKKILSTGNVHDGKSE